MKAAWPELAFNCLFQFTDLGGKRGEGQLTKCLGRRIEDKQAFQPPIDLPARDDRIAGEEEHPKILNHFTFPIQSGGCSFPDRTGVAQDEYTPKVAYIMLPKNQKMVLFSHMSSGGTLGEERKKWSLNGESLSCQRVLVHILSNNWPKLSKKSPKEKDIFCLANRFNKCMLSLPSDRAFLTPLGIILFPSNSKKRFERIYLAFELPICTYVFDTWPNLLSDGKDHFESQIPHPQWIHLKGFYLL
ncbi:hypothetical protein EGR_07622 [Echinococcus granulosus]|uniref:Uncharacterized protein n=1 Tax=Echinococcus granulosus TaxID=6210 RepID=W6UAH4_ECHGR|nr:hypothetical protein EGR_07622 [Echinococcus granulosus]EUB57531.1 hypothetical protein EGR_07622 [Echinococcus granulosus]